MKSGTYLLQVKRKDELKYDHHSQKIKVKNHFSKNPNTREQTDATIYYSLLRPQDHKTNLPSWLLLFSNGLVRMVN